MPKRQRQGKKLKDLTAQESTLFFQELHARIGEILASFELQWAEIESEALIVGPFFAQIGSWLPHSLYMDEFMDIWQEVRSLKEQGQLTDEKLKSLILAKFREDDGVLLKGLVADWYDDERFAQRQHIFNDALEAHINRKFTLSIPTLLPQIEGIGAQILGVTPGKRDSARYIVDMVEEAADKSQDVLEIVAGDIAAEVLYEVFYNRLMFEDFNKELQTLGLGERRFLHRHAILHGVELHYDSEENSLRAFLILDWLHSLSRRQAQAEL